MAQKRRTAAGAHDERPSGSSDHDVLPINQQFAQHYEASKRRQLLSNAPPHLLQSSDESSSSSSEEEDDLGELLTKRIDRQVRTTLTAIRNKDPRIYDSNVKFFDDPPSNDSQDEKPEQLIHSDDEPVAGWDAIGEAAKRDTPKLTLKDYVRETLLKEGRLSDSDTDSQSPHNRTHIESDHAAKQQQQHAEMEHDREEEGDFFTKKTKTDAEIEKEQHDFDAFLTKRAAKSAKKAGEDLLLHSYLEKENPDQKERFLRDFVLNNGWLDSNAAPAPAARDYEIEIDLPNPDSDAEQRFDEQDEEFEDKNDQFEATYNFRFEDPEGAQIVSHARDIPQSIRRPDERRKKAREARRLRKQQEKAAKIDDIKRLRNLKKRDIEARLLAIQEAAGDEVDLSGFDLDADFDPDQFNEQMETRFGDEYYARQDDQMKKIEKHNKSGAPHPSMRENTNVPDDIRDDVNRMVDEYYNLNYEDIIGGAPVRFKYKKVDPESFNLTPEDILTRDDKELNRIVSLKYLAPYRSQREVKKKAWKAAAVVERQKSSGQKENGYGAEDEAVHQNGEDTKKAKKRKKRRKEERITETEDVDQVASRWENHDQDSGSRHGKQSEAPEDAKKTKRRKKRRKEERLSETGGVDQAASRLENHDQDSVSRDGKQGEAPLKTTGDGNEDDLTRSQRKRRKRTKRIKTEVSAA